MYIDWFNQQTKRWNRAQVSSSFEMHGELFGAHKSTFKGKWTVSHVATGLSVLPQNYDGSRLPTTRAAALALAKASLEARTPEAVKAAVERGRRTMDDIIAEYGPPPSA
jgi:hypothetical protein